MENKSFVKLYKKFIHWEWYDDINTKILFIHLLLTVNWKDGAWHGITVPRGSKVTSYAKLSKEIGISIQQTRTAISNLLSTQEITVVSTHTYTMINVLKYGTYQINEKIVTQLPTQNDEQNQQAINTQSNAQVTTIEEIKELKEVKNKERIKTYSDLINDFTQDLELKKALNEFVDMRKKMKGFTTRALELALSKLSKIESDETTRISIVNESIEKGWKTFYEQKKENNNYQQKGKAELPRWYQESGKQTEQIEESFDMEKFKEKQKKLGGG